MFAGNENCAANITAKKTACAILGICILMNTIKRVDKGE